MIGYTFDAIEESGRVDVTYVSTDDPDVEALARTRPFKLHARAADLATHTTLIGDVLAEFLERDNSISPDDLVLLLQPTSPLRRAEHIVRAIEQFKGDGKARSLVSVTDYEWPPQFALAIVGDRAAPVDELFGQGRVRRTDAAPLFRPNGAIYLASAATLLEFRSFYTDAILPFRMDRLDSIDVDSAEDCVLAAAILTVKTEEKRRVGTQ